MDCLQNADRRSLLMEIQVLHSQMNSRKTNVKREQEIDPKSQGVVICTDMCTFAYGEVFIIFFLL